MESLFSKREESYFKRQVVDEHDDVVDDDDFDWEGRRQSDAEALARRFFVKVDFFHSNIIDVSLINRLEYCNSHA